MSLRSCIYEGRLRHRRFLPIEHAFQRSLFMMYLDLDELDRVFQGRWLWSTHRPALARFRREDHFGDPAVSLDAAVRDLVERRKGTRPRGPIRLLTHPRYLGYGFNPASFYFCFGEGDRSVETVVVEVTNTPWRERHCYVLKDEDAAAAGKHRFRHRKELHVSPFLEMGFEYRWRMTEPGQTLALHVENVKESKTHFDAMLTLRRREITSRNLARVLLRYPLMTEQVTLGIHLQALRLWLKGVPVQTHPKRMRDGPQELGDP